jgi:hypothetical protein
MISFLNCSFFQFGVDPEVGSALLFLKDFSMDDQESACLQCGTDDHRWDPHNGNCAECGFDEVHGFSPVPQIYEHFLRCVLSASPQRIEPSTPKCLMAEFVRVFATPEELADGWDFLRAHPEYVIDVVHSTSSRLH